MSRSVEEENGASLHSSASTRRQIRCTVDLEAGSGVRTHAIHPMTETYQSVISNTGLNPRGLATGVSFPSGVQLLLRA
jgi:hypothetical protein